MKKQDVMQLVHDMPEEIDIDEFIHRLNLKKRLDQADAAADAGEVVPHEKVEREIESWFA